MGGRRSKGRLLSEEEKREFLDFLAAAKATGHFATEDEILKSFFGPGREKGWKSHILSGRIGIDPEKFWFGARRAQEELGLSTDPSGPRLEEISNRKSNLSGELLALMEEEQRLTGQPANLEMLKLLKEEFPKKEIRPTSF